jgi:hypothetical protein
MNKGTKINEILKAQGFSHHDYGRTSSYSTSTGLRVMVYAYTSNATHFIIDDDEDGTYTISTGLKPTHTVLASGVVEKALKDTFEKEIAKNVK